MIDWEEDGESIDEEGGKRGLSCVVKSQPNSSLKRIAICIPPCCGKTYLSEKHPEIFYDIDEVERKDDIFKKKMKILRKEAFSGYRNYKDVYKLGLDEYKREWENSGKICVLVHSVEMAIGLGIHQANILSVKPIKKIFNENVSKRVQAIPAQEKGKLRQVLSSIYDLSSGKEVKDYLEMYKVIFSFVREKTGRVTEYKKGNTDGLAGTRKEKRDLCPLIGYGNEFSETIKERRCAAVSTTNVYEALHVQYQIDKAKGSLSFERLLGYTIAALLIVSPYNSKNMIEWNEMKEPIAIAMPVGTGKTTFVKQNKDVAYDIDDAEEGHKSLLDKSRKEVLAKKKTWDEHNALAWPLMKVNWEKSGKSILLCHTTRIAVAMGIKESNVITLKLPLNVTLEAVRKRWDDEKVHSLSKEEMVEIATTNWNGCGGEICRNRIDMSQKINTFIAKYRSRKDIVEEKFEVKEHLSGWLEGRKVNGQKFNEYILKSISRVMNVEYLDQKLKLINVKNESESGVEYSKQAMVDVITRLERSARKEGTWDENFSRKHLELSVEKLAEIDGKKFIVTGIAGVGQTRKLQWLVNMLDGHYEVSGLSEAIAETVYSMVSGGWESFSKWKKLLGALGKYSSACEGIDPAIVDVQCDMEREEIKTEDNELAKPMGTFKIQYDFKRKMDVGALLTVGLELGVFKQKGIRHGALFVLDDKGDDLTSRRWEQYVRPLVYKEGEYRADKQLDRRAYRQGEDKSYGSEEVKAKHDYAVDCLVVLLEYVKYGHRINCVGLSGYQKGWLWMDKEEVNGMTENDLREKVMTYPGGVTITGVEELGKKVEREGDDVVGLFIQKKLKELKLTKWWNLIMGLRSRFVQSSSDEREKSLQNIQLLNALQNVQSYLYRFSLVGYAHADLVNFTGNYTSETRVERDEYSNVETPYYESKLHDGISKLEEIEEADETVYSQILKDTSAGGGNSITLLPINDKATDAEIFLKKRKMKFKFRKMRFGSKPTNILFGTAYSNDDKMIEDFATIYNPASIGNRWDVAKEKGRSVYVQPPQVLAVEYAIKYMFKKYESKKENTMYANEHASGSALGDKKYLFDCQKKVSEDSGRVRSLIGAFDFPSWDMHMRAFVRVMAKRTARRMAPFSKLSETWLSRAANIFSKYMNQRAWFKIKETKSSQMLFAGDAGTSGNMYTTVSNSWKHGKIIDCVIDALNEWNNATDGLRKWEDGLISSEATGQ